MTLSRSGDTAEGNDTSFLSGSFVISATCCLSNDGFCSISGTKGFCSISVTKCSGSVCRGVAGTRFVPSGVAEVASKPEDLARVRGAIVSHVRDRVAPAG